MLTVHDLPKHAAATTQNIRIRSKLLSSPYKYPRSNRGTETCRNVTITQSPLNSKQEKFNTVYIHHVFDVININSR